MIIVGDIKKQVEGTGKEAKGKVKEEAGKAMHKPGMEAKGKVEQVAGKAEKKLGDIEHKHKR